MLLRLARFIAGLVAGAVLWFYLTPAYDQALATTAGVLLKADHRFAEARMTAPDRIIHVARAGKSGDFPPADIPADQLTFNIVLLTALFASNRRPFQDRNVVAFLVSAVIVVLLHPPGLLLSIEATYASRMGTWSDTHYGTVAAYIWHYGEVFWRLIGMFALVVACWWVGSAGPEAPQKKRRRTG